MFLFHPIHFVKFLVKSQPQRSYNKGSHIKKRMYSFTYCLSIFADLAKNYFRRVTDLPQRVVTNELIRVG